MKTKFKRIGKQSLSVILAVMMMVSTMLVGMVSTNAAEFNGDYLYVDLSKCASTITLRGINIYENENGQNEIAWLSTSNTEFKDLGGRIYQFNVGGYLTEGKTIQSVQVALNGTSSKTENVTDASYDCLQVSSTGDSVVWTTYRGGSTTNEHTVNVTYNADHVNSITLGGKPVASSGAGVTVNNGDKPTLKVTLKPNCKITSVTQDSAALTPESDGTYKLQAVNAATTITVNTEATSTPTGDSVVYFANPVSGGWSNVYAYMWKEGTETKNATWPGEEQKIICQEDYVYKSTTYKVYKVTIPSDYNRVIFNNNTVQTGDITFTSGTLYIYTSNKAEPTKVSGYSEPATDYTLTWNEPTTNVSGATISNSGTVAYGTEVTVKVNVVNNGYEATLVISDVDVTKSVSGNEYTFKFKMPANDIIVAPAVSAKGVAVPTISFGAAVGTGSTLNAYAGENKTISVQVIPQDDSYTVVDEANSKFAQLTYNNTVVNMDSYIVESAENTNSSKTFKFDEVGAYQLTYNGAVKSTVDASKTAATNATLTINVTYSDTQQAYVDLKALVDDTTTYPESVTSEQYSSGVTEYNNARTAAANAVTGSLPDYNAEDTYTALKTALVTAKNNLVANKAFYIGGQFKTSTAENPSTWTDHPDKIQFEYVSPNLYKVETGLNLSDNNGKYFYVYSKSGSFYKDYGDATTTSNREFKDKNSLTNAVTLTNCGYSNGHQLTLTGADAPDAVIWLDTSGLNDDGTGSMKIFYTSGMPTAKYSITGDASSGENAWASAWNEYSSTYTVNGETGNPFVFRKQITVEGDKYFRIITSDKTQYAPKDDGYPVTGAKYTTLEQNYNAFKITSGSYFLYLDQSGATPVIWIEPADYNVSAKAMYTYDGSTYLESDQSLVTVNPNKVAVNGNTTVTATDTMTGYKFIGWESTNGTFTNAFALETTFTPNADGAVAIAKYGKVLTANVTKGTGSKEGNWSTVANSYLAGETVTITFTPNSATDMVTDVTVNGESKLTSLVDNTLTFTAGVSSNELSEMNIVVTFGARPQHSFDVDYVTGCDRTMGTISGTGEGKYDYNTEITLTASAKDGYTFVGWYDNINGTGAALSTNPTYKFNLTADTEVFAKFAENTGTPIPDLYLIYTTGNDNSPVNFTQYFNLYRDSSNNVYAYLNKDNGFDPTKTYKFMISTQYGDKAFRGTVNYNMDTGKVTVNSSNTDVIQSSDNGEFGYTDEGTGGVGYKKYYSGKFSVKEDYQELVSSVKINLGYYNATDNKIQKSASDTNYTMTYTVIPTVTGSVVNKIKIYAKDGTIRSTYQKYADMADTVLSADDGVLTKYSNTPAYYEEAYAPVGSTITVTTTIDANYKETYFVKAFCINGISYGIIDKSQADTQNGVYTCTYTIPEDCTDKFIEITPIYYYIDYRNTVTFYVEGFEENVQNVWGNTIAVQAWYNNGSETADATLDTKNALGGYPGQPLVYEGGKYSMQIPKYLNGVEENTVKGITLNNYIWDDIHKKIGKTNAQTYDYDDFYKLANKTDVDNIIFDFRYRTETDNDPSQSGLSSSKYETKELEPLTDYYGNIVDLFGNELSESWTTDFDSKYLTVISNGYVNNYIGKYATEWSVYDHDGKYITTINCSQLLDANNLDSAYTSAYNTLKPYANFPVKIAYEKSIFSGDQKGNRADGRWYYSTKAKKITSNVIIQYKQSDASPFIQDEFDTDSNVGSATGTKVYFTNADYYGKTSCDGEVDGGNFSVCAETDSEAKYYFIGWYLKTSDGYAFMSNDPDYDIPMTNNETYVARFIPTPSGTLTLSHTILPNSDSAIGRTYIKADIVSADGKTVLYSIPETSGNLVVPSKYVTYTSTNKIRVTLKTVPYGKDTVEGFYNSEEIKYQDATVGGTGEKTYQIERLINTLFTESDDGSGNKTYNLTKSNILYYSKITSQPLNYEITYIYKTRRDGEKKYVIKDTVSGIELEEMWAANVAAGVTKEQLSKAFITKKAPFVSNFREVITWKIDEAVIDGYTATVNSKTDQSKVKISAYTANNQWTEIKKITYATLATALNGEYFYKTGTDLFPVSKTYNEKPYAFSFWAIFDNKNDAETFNGAVTAYMNGSPAENMKDRLTAITGLEGYKSLIAKSYSKEFNYICYQDYFIVPVYAGTFTHSDISESQASIRLLEYTRNQWTNANGVNGNGEAYDQNGKTDYLYTDFALSFDKDQLLIQNNKNIKVGIAFEIVDKYDTEKGSDLTKYFTESNEGEIEKLIKSKEPNGKVGSYIYGTETKSRSVYRYEINNSTISVKNRIEYYLRFSNTQKAQQNVMKVYSYIYDTKTGEIHLSDPVYMNLYDIGNLTYITSDLASIDLGSAQ